MLTFFCRSAIHLHSLGGSWLETECLILEKNEFRALMVVEKICCGGVVNVGISDRHGFLCGSKRGKSVLKCVGPLFFAACCVCLLLALANPPKDWQVSPDRHDYDGITGKVNFSSTIGSIKSQDLLIFLIKFSNHSCSAIILWIIEFVDLASMTNP